MKKLTAVFLLLLLGATQAAAPIDEIVTECIRQMNAGSCIALNDPGDYTAQQLSRPMNLDTLGSVPFSAYLAVRGSGDMRMCATALDACRADFGSDRCKVARALWGGGK
jgi:hypothetical protein